VRVLVTGSAGHLGEALVRSLRASGTAVVGLDLMASPWTDVRAGVGAFVQTSTPSAFGRADAGGGRARRLDHRGRRSAAAQQLRGGLGRRMFPSIDRVYVNDRARADLGWRPRYDFRHALELLRAGREPRSVLATSVGAKGYHPGTTGPSTTR
jgi:UDP-glucose 4-epimerase